MKRQPSGTYSGRAARFKIPETWALFDVPSLPPRQYNAILPQRTSLFSERSKTLRGAMPFLLV